MVRPAPDFTDSEDEGEGSVQRGSSSWRSASPPQAGASTSHGNGPSIKLTLRPNLNHLINDETSEPVPGSSRRSSHSPPPRPLTLKFGRPAAAAAAAPSRAERAAHYSSSEGEDDDGGARGREDVDVAAEARRSAPPSKKVKVSHAKSPRSKGRHSIASGLSSPATPSTGLKIHPPPTSYTTTPTGEGKHSAQQVPALHRKAYDWLQPGSAGASHRGPPERPERTEKERDVDAELEASLLGEDSKLAVAHAAGDATPEAKPKKAPKRRPDGVAGPGKAWRKGLKKGMPLPWKEGGGGAGGPEFGTPGTHGLQSVEVTPEAEDNAPVIAHAHAAAAREPSPPFVLADAATLGHPVFAKPIVAPKIQLSSFPKVGLVPFLFERPLMTQVTQFFAPNNGGDAVFPRKEKVRHWELDTKILVGISGGVLRYRGWARGPPSELGRLIQADREAKEAQRAAKNKLNLERKELEKLENSGAGGGGPQADWPNRPALMSNASFDSTTAPAGLMTSGGGDEAASEAGDADSLIGSLVDEPAAPGRTPERAAGGKGKRGGGPKGQKAKQPRKSKLAQEIGPEDGMDIDAQ